MSDDERQAALATYQQCLDILARTAEEHDGEPVSVAFDDAYGKIRLLHDRLAEAAP